MLIDTHSHLNMNAFRDDSDAVVRRALEADTWMINVGADYKTSRRAIDLANRYEKGVYASVGLHPMHLFQFRAQTEDYDFETRGEEFNNEAYQQLIQFEKVVAVGEIGLDYYHMDIGVESQKVKALQQEVFRAQIILAREHDLPAIIHCRQAHDDMVAIIKDLRKERRELFGNDRPWGVMHCFSGDENLAWEYFGQGLLISFTGLITFSQQWDELIRKLPADRYMVETDCPFMTPEPYRGTRNEPAYVSFVADRIAQIRRQSAEKIAEQTTRTAREFFGI